jgi:protein ImuB
VGRLACVDAPAFALQLLLRRRPQWRGLPAAVVDRDAPHGVILWANELARAKGVLPGLRYAAALALCTELRAGEIENSEIRAGIEQTCECLRRHSPHVEPSREEPGVFWLDVDGLELWIASQREAPAAESTAEARRTAAGARQHVRQQVPPHVRRSGAAKPANSPPPLPFLPLPPPTTSPLARWARATRDALAREGLESAIVVGFAHFRVYALAKALRGGRVLVFDAAADEQSFTLRVPLRRLGIEPRTRAELERLGVWRIADLVALPAAGLQLRYGDELARLHALASHSIERELAPLAPPDWPSQTLDLDFPTGDLDTLLALACELAPPLLALLARRGQAASEVTLQLELEDRSLLEERVEPAEPTLDFAHFARLLRLRFERLKLARGVQRLTLRLRGVATAAKTGELFALGQLSSARGRAPQAATKAFAALRAAFGDDVVVRARLVSAHLPEAGFAWESVGELPPPRPRDVLSPTLVRRIFAKSAPLPSRSRHEEDGWLLRGVTHGPVLQLHGPYPLSGGWWRAEVARDYHFAEMQSGALLWIYFDRVRRRWFLQGSVS